MLTVYHLGVSQSERALWVCEELGIDYKLVRFDRDPVTRLAPREYKQLSPTETAPVITDIGKNGEKITISESGAVVEYIDAVYGNSRLALSKDDPDYATYLFWFHLANASLMAMFMVEMVTNAVAVDSDSPVLALIKNRIRIYLELLDKQVAKTQWAGGDKFTLADILIVFPLTTGRHFVPIDLQPYPHVQEYVQRIYQRPAYQRAMKKGDPNLPRL